MSSFLISMTASVNEESRVEAQTSTTYSRHAFCVDQLIIAVASLVRGGTARTPQYTSTSNYYIVCTSSFTNRIALFEGINPLITNDAKWRHPV